MRLGKVIVCGVNNAKGMISCMIDRELKYFQQLTSWNNVEPKNVAKRNNDSRSITRSSKNITTSLLKESMAVYAALCVGGEKR